MFLLSINEFSEAEKNSVYVALFPSATKERRWLAPEAASSPSLTARHTIAMALLSRGSVICIPDKCHISVSEPCPPFLGNLRLHPLATQPPSLPLLLLFAPFQLHLMPSISTFYADLAGHAHGSSKLGNENNGSAWKELKRGC